MTVSNKNEGNELVLLASTLAIAISNEVENNNHLNIIAEFITALGDNLNLLAAQRERNPGARN